jgi:dethiobiotin synthetase
MTDALPAAGVFLVGTDTGVGKTALGCALLRLALRAGLCAIPSKPVETGCDSTPADAQALLAASRHPSLTLTEVCPLPFRPPVAPAQAAEEAGVPLSRDRLIALLPPPPTPGDFLLVESAGGLLSPYASDCTSADLAAASALPVLLVARNALGTINHAALALAEIRRRALPLVGLILMTPTPGSSPDAAYNPRLIEVVSGERPLAVLPHVPNADPDLLADELARQIPPAALLALLQV